MKSQDFKVKTDEVNDLKKDKNENKRNYDVR